MSSFGDGGLEVLSYSHAYKYCIRELRRFDKVTPSRSKNKI